MIFFKKISSYFTQENKYTSIESLSTSVESQESAPGSSANSVRFRGKAFTKVSIQGSANNLSATDLENHNKVIKLAQKLLDDIKKNEEIDLGNRPKNLWNLFINNLNNLESDDLIKLEVKSICNCIKKSYAFYSSFLNFVRQQPTDPRFEPYRTQFSAARS